MILCLFVCLFFKLQNVILRQLSFLARIIKSLVGCVHFFTTPKVCYCNRRLKEYVTVPN